MRISTWNIRAGGGKRTEQIAAVILEESPDVLVITEFRPKPGVRLLQLLESANYHRISGEPDGPHNSVCVLSKLPIQTHTSPLVPRSVHRWINVVLDSHDLVILGVHVPNVSEVWNKREFLECIEAFAVENLNKKALVIGDLNTARNEDCEGAFINEATYFNRYLDLGWVDAWRASHPEAREFTWYSHRNNGFRLDHCLVSPMLARLVKSAEYRHDVRINRLSDHSLMTVELELTS